VPVELAAGTPDCCLTLQNGPRKKRRADDLSFVRRLLIAHPPLNTPGCGYNWVSDFARRLFRGESHAVLRKC
jgi:hypothetical protein